MTDHDNPLRFSIENGRLYNDSGKDGFRESMKTTRLKEKIERLKEEMARLEALEAERRERPDQQISLTDPDARSMATSGRGSGTVGYNVQTAVDIEHHLIVTHEVTNVGQCPTYRLGRSQKNSGHC